MSYTVEDLEKIALKMRYNLTALQGQVSDLLTALGEVTPLLPEPAEFSCPICGPLAQVRSHRRLEEHMANVHD